jgi:anti-sigma-K factor RskA
MTHEEHKGLLALAALGATDEREQGALDAHLAACGECRAELRALADTAALLAHHPAPVAPPPELRARLLSEIKSVGQGAAPARQEAAPPREAALPRAAGVVSLEEARAASREKRDARQGRWASPVSRPAALFGALAASVAIFALGVSLFVLWQRNNELRREVAQLSSQLGEARGRLDATGSELARARFESELLAAPDSRTARLSGTEVARSARAKLTFNDATGEAILVASQLPAAPAGKAYQLWYIAGGKPLPGSVFTPDPSGRGELRSSIPPEGRRAEIFAVTLEPAGGLPAPSGEIYLKGPAS